MTSSDFIGRERQLDLIERELARVMDSGRGGLLTLRGRRRVGKSTLLEQFLVRTRVPAAFFTASGQSLPVELERFQKVLAESGLPMAGSLASGMRAPDWETALGQIAASMEGGPAGVLILDEFPYLVQSDDSIQGVVQVAWDKFLSRVPLLVVLVGSDLGMMEMLTEYGSPLYGRPTREMVVEPLTPAEIGDLLGMAPVATFDAYLTIGGFPQLAGRMREESDWRDFLRASFADYSSPLIVDGERAVDAEFPSDTSARAVLRSIGAGNTTFKRLLQRTGVAQSALAEALRVLERKRVIIRSRPFGAGPRSRLTRYFISDPYLRFWHRFIEPSMPLVERGRGDLAVKRLFEHWSDYRGRAIEPVVRRSLEQMFPLEGLEAAQFAPAYWTRDNSVEIDLVGTNDETGAGRVVFAGSIKWRERSLFGRDDVRALQEMAKQLPGDPGQVPLIAVSRTGVSAGLEGLTASFGPGDLIAAWR